MQSGKKLVFLVIFSLLIQDPLFCQNPISNLKDYSIQIWTTDEGLPSNNLNQVVQDKLGYIWVSSFNGLIRFDGNTFDIFNSDILPELKSNAFNSIAEDNSGNMYFGTLTSGLVKYNGNSFSLHKIDSSFSKSITAISIDSKNNVWVGARNSPLYIHKPFIERFDTKEVEFLKNATVSCILETDEGDIWFGTVNNGIVVYSSEQFTQLSGKELQIRWLEQYDRKIFIGTGNGVYTYEGETWKVIEGTQGYIINNLSHDRFGNLWVATETGLIRVTQEGKVEYLTEEDGIPSRQISSLLFDSEGNIWCATKRGGLVILRQSNFVNISLENGLSSQFINTIGQLRDGVIAIASDNGDIALMKDDAVTQMSIKTNLENVSIKNILLDRQGEIWLATYKGVVRINNDTEQVLTTSEGLPSNSPRCLFEDKFGNIWIGSNDGGLVKIRPDGTRKIYSVDTGLSDNYVFCIEQLPNNNIIVGTYNGGVNIISENDEITILDLGMDNSSPLIFNIEIVDNDEYWLATDVGLFKYQNGSFHKIDKNDGLRVKTIFDVEIDDYGYLWLTSNLGVVRVKITDVNDFISEQNPSVNGRLYDEKDGMLSGECTGATKVFTAASGKIWIPTSNGVSIIDPANVYVNNKIPPIYIKSIMVDGEVISSINESVNLTPGSKRLTIDYTALNFYAPAKINFKYRLRGFEKEWKEVGNKYQATYTNLPDGKFTFEVMAANNDGFWNEVPATVEIRLEPFFYASRLFYLLLGGFVLVSALIIYWIRIRVVEEKNIELHKLNSELDSFVYSVSHDLRAPLSSILGLISISKLDKDSINLPIYLEKIETSVNKLDSFIKDIISYSRNVRLEVDMEELDLRRIVEEVFEGLAYMNIQDNIKIIIESSENTLFHSDKTRLQVILNNIISNAFRYSKSYINDSFIKVKIVVGKSSATISVEDNGIGIKPDILKKVFEMFYRGSDTSNGSGLGLYIAQEAVAKLDGSIKVDSVYGRGTTFTISLDNLEG